MRDALIHEIALLQQIENEADSIFRAAGHPEYDLASPIEPDIARRAIERGGLIVATVDAQPVGWACIEPIEHSTEWYLRQISVLPSRQQHGVGSRLLREVIARAAAQGARSITLSTQADVAWNRPWYERFGFRVVAEEDWTPHMREIACSLAAAGFDNATRCHMRLNLDHA